MGRIDVVEFARQILEMHEEVLWLRGEVAELREYRDKYTEELNRSISHSRDMLGGILQIAMTPGVMDAIDANHRSQHA